MAKNEFLPFGIAEGANVLSNQEYERLAARFNGFTSGVAKSKELNTVWRQSSVMSSALAQFIVDSDNKDLLDNGDTVGIKNRLVAAIKQTISGVGYVTTAAMNLELNKKIDKANISGVKGNGNDKVPSLNLFTTEIGKLASLGYSYSKIESDGRYQPKGNYAPAGDYATKTEVNSKLAKDKNGADIPDKPKFIKNLGLAGGVNSSAVGRLVGVQKITSSKTYIPTAGTRFAVVEMVGGGGAGGSPTQNGAGFTSGSGGGNSGCYVRFLVDLSAVSSVNCTIGAAGLPAPQATGGTGGDTSFGIFATMQGGNGGLLLSSSNTPNRVYGMNQPRHTFGAVSNVELMDYDNGGLGSDAVILGTGARAGFGGMSKLGGATYGPGNDTPGIDASTYGGGGSGVVATDASFGTNLLGGKGAGGVIIIMEYA